MPPIVLLALGIVALLAALACWCALMRIAARSYAPLVATLAALLFGAGLCAAISASKTGGYVAGIIGYLFYMALLSIAAGLIFGVVLQLVWRWLGREDPARRPAPLTPAWDLIGFSTLSLIAVLLSALE